MSDRSRAGAHFIHTGPDDIMLSPPPRPPGIPGYDFSAPTEASTSAALQRVFGPDRGVARWGDACKAAGLVPGRVDDDARLERAIRALSEQGGAAAAVARSVEIRMRTYTRLAARAAASKGGSE